MSHPEALPATPEAPPAAGLLGRIAVIERWVSPSRVALVLLAVCAVAIAGAPSAYLSFDEAKYLAIGRNVLLGHGPVTDFGSKFLAHSPLFAVVLAAPQQAFGIDALAWGHVLDAVGFVAVVGLTVLLARSRGPWVGVLAGAGIGAWIMLFSLSRTARLDVPQAALVLLYAWIALRAASSGRIFPSLAAGFVLAVAFLVKESAIVLGPIPYLVAIGAPGPWHLEGSVVRAGERLRRVVFSGAIVLLVFVAGTSWWFGWVGSLTGRLYLISLPARDGPILAAIVAVVGVAALVASGPARRVAGWERIGRWLDGGPAGPSPDRTLVPKPVGTPSARPLWLAAALAVAWTGVLIVALARSGVLHGTTLFSLSALGSYVGTWGVAIAPVVVFGLGAIPAIVDLVTGHHPGAQPAVRLLAIGGLLASIGWTLLVVATGEPPRNLIVQASLLVILAADGWTAAILELDRLRDPVRRVAFVVGGAVAGAWAASILEQTGTRASLPLTLVVIIAGAVAGLVLAMIVSGRIPASVQGMPRVGGEPFTPGEPFAPGEPLTPGEPFAPGKPLVQGEALAAAPDGGLRPLERPTGPVLAPGSQSPSRPWGGHLVAAAAIATTLVAAMTVAAGAAAAFQPNRENQARAAATAAIAGWLDANVAPGASVTFGSLQAHETAVTLDGRYELTMLAPEVGTIDPRASLGLRSASRTSADWIAMDAHPRLQALYAFRASRVTSLIEKARPVVVVYVSGLPTSAPSLVGALLASTGVTPAQHWSWPIRGGAIVVDILRIDPSAFRLPTDRVYADAGAVSRLAARLRTSVAGSTAATELAARLTFWPTSADDARALGELDAAARRPH